MAGAVSVGSLTVERFEPPSDVPIHMLKMETFWRGWQAGSDGTEMPVLQMCLPVGLCENCSLEWEEEVSDNFLFLSFSWIMVVCLVSWLSFLLTEALSTEKRNVLGFFFFPL